MLKSQSGVALLMVMSAVSILSFLLAVFVYNVKINKIRLYNQIDKVQARLNAEAGIAFALSKLQLYQLSMNALEKDKNLKDRVSPRILESIISQPFMFPIPSGALKNANLIVRNAIEAFTKSIKLDGELSVEIRAMSGMLNPNNMRKVTSSEEDKDKEGQEEEEEQDDQTDENKSKEKTPPHIFMEKKLIEALSKAMESKREEDDEFDARYSNTEPKQLIKEMKYFITAAGQYNESDAPDLENLYRDSNTIPKHSPFTSLSELYLLQGWDDTLINLIKNQLSVHDVTVVSLNEMTKDQLEMFFPEIGPIQVEEFFKYRDGSKDDESEPNEFKNVSEFKELIVNRLGVVDDKTYTERIQEFENAGIKLGVAGKLFKVTSIGKYGRSSFTINAYVDMPIKPTIPPKVNADGKPATDPPVDPDNNAQDENKTTTTTEKAGSPTEYMAPRIIEFITGSE
jgi:hypothetical protein